MTAPADSDPLASNPLTWLTMAELALADGDIHEALRHLARLRRLLEATP